MDELDALDIAMARVIDRVNQMPHSTAEAYATEPAEFSLLVLALHDSACHFLTLLMDLGDDIGGGYEFTDEALVQRDAEGNGQG